MNNGERILNLVRLMDKHGPEKYLREIFGQLFHVDPKDTVAIYEQLGHLKKLIRDTEEQIRLIPNIDHDRYIKGLKAVKRVAELESVGGQFQSLKSAVGETTQIILEFVAERLNDLPSQPEIKQDDLNKFGVEIGALIQDVEQSDLDRSIKIVLHDCLTSALRSITEYQIRGVRGMRQELFSILEKLQTNWGTLEKQKKHPVESKVFQTIAKLDSLTSLAMNLNQIAQTFSPLTPLLAGG